ncbi:SPRY domain-containing SOCS box protein 3 isoform X2 [Photinus pyralis]|uniref:SPRY domain-containing SOCS box protein 3 isoform X2 n=1 Tax=Photinus pyralis TaxID=7054 RepID=UPI001267753E|nr:SPRY domain-containing SOCS box protein 3 isoform X2 [Photinus pyralis]
MTSVQQSPRNVSRGRRRERVNASQRRCDRSSDSQLQVFKATNMEDEKYELHPLMHGCDDSWTWNRREKSREVTLYGNSFNIAHFHPNWSSGTAGVRGTRVLNNGEDCHGWGLSHKGLLWHGGTWYHYTKPFRENEATVIGILFDGVDGTLTFYKDGKCLGIAFRGLHEVKQSLYPMVCSTAAKTEMKLTGMKRDFVNLQDRCRAVILKCVVDKTSIDELMIPPRIKGYLKEGINEIRMQPFQPISENEYLLGT